MEDMYTIRLLEIRCKILNELTNCTTEIDLIIRRYKEGHTPACKTRRDMLKMLPDLYRCVQRYEMLKNKEKLKAFPPDKQLERQYHDLLDITQTNYEFIGKSVDLLNGICYGYPEYSISHKKSAKP